MAWTEEGHYANNVTTEDGNTTMTFSGGRLDSTGVHIFANALTTSLSMSATAALTIAGASRDARAGPLAVAATATLTVAGASRNAQTSLAMAATATLTIAGATRATFAGSLALAATADLEIADATVTTPADNKVSSEVFEVDFATGRLRASSEVLEVDIYAPGRAGWGILIGKHL